MVEVFPFFLGVFLSSPLIIQGIISALKSDVILECTEAVIQMLCLHNSLAILNLQYMDRF